MELTINSGETHSFVVETEQRNLPVISGENIEAFLSFIESQGRTKQTIDTYRRCLERLYAFLPDDKVIGADTLRQWREMLREDGLALRTLNLHISTVNSYLEFLGHREFQLRPLAVSYEKPETPALSWPEYLRLLQTARTKESKKPYLLIKLFCNTGIRICELPNVTVEAVKTGEIVIGYKKRPKRVPLPSLLRMELLDYADSVGIQSGSLFVRQSGEPLINSEILPIIIRLFKQADVPREKATTKTLRQFYRTTREEIHAEIAAQVEGAYESVLNKKRSSPLI